MSQFTFEPGYLAKMAQIDFGASGMKRSSNKAMLTVVLVTSSLLAACVELKQAGRTVGHTTRDVAKQIGHGTRDVAKNIGHGTKRVLAEMNEPEDEEEQP